VVLARGPGAGNETVKPMYEAMTTIIENFSWNTIRASSFVIAGII